MRQPNFFILGAPKCGTTSMASWLSGHPEVFVSPWKEPRYFDRDLRTRFRIRADQYSKLFDGATVKHVAVGEATVWYLFSREAVSNIERELPGSRHIAMVRNPIEMAYALHEQMLVNQTEHIRDFERAWGMSPLRRQGRGARAWVIEPKLIDYQGLCSLGHQLGSVFDVVSRDRVLVVVLDDLRADPRRTYDRVLEFLGVEDDGREDFPVRNPAKQIRWHSGQRLLVAALKGERVLKSRLGAAPVNSTLLRKLGALNRSPRPRPALSAEMMARLQEYFAPDVAELSRLLQRDFSSWLTSPTDSSNPG